MYRISRNIEASLVDWLTSKLQDDGWKGIRVEKVFAEIYKGKLPCILVQANLIDPKKLEIGSRTWLKTFEVNIKIFADSDGIRLDLSDWLLDKLEDDIDYYVYTVTDGVVSNKVLNSKIVILSILRHEKELTNTENLELEDKYRHITTFTCRVPVKGDC
jgi:hypothetical protein